MELIFVHGTESGWQVNFFLCVDAWLEHRIHALGRPRGALCRVPRAHIRVGLGSLTSAVGTSAAVFFQNRSFVSDVPIWSWHCLSLALLCRFYNQLITSPKKNCYWLFYWDSMPRMKYPVSYPIHESGVSRRLFRFYFLSVKSYSCLHKHCWLHYS